jgi:glycosyltransferase involved in cell wall biosynthesis
MTLSLVLPCFNEEKVIEHTVREAYAWFAHERIEGEVIVVNDGSTDGTEATLEHLRTVFPRLVIVRHEGNQGYGAALRSGCDTATMDAIAVMDSDGQFRVHDLNRLLPQLHAADVVAGIRLHRADPFIRSLNAFLYNQFIRIVLGIREKDVDCGMKAFRRSAWPSIRPARATGALFSAELFYRAACNGLQVHQVTVEHFPRLHGRPTGANLRVIVRMFRDLWRLLRREHRRPNHSASVGSLIVSID